MSKLLKSQLFNGDYNYAEPMGINAGIRNNQVYNDLYYNAKPYNISKDLTTDPIITTSFKPQIEPSINRDKIGNPSILIQILKIHLTLFPVIIVLLNLRPNVL